jgi:hypothetical protein
MRREDVEELHFITSIANVPSILEHGILSNQRAKGMVHTSIAMEEVQSLRDTKAVPGGRGLHDYANLYFTARNPMMFKRKDAHAEICVLRISAAVLDLPGVVVTDRNAARGWARFREPDAGLERLDKDELFADDWRHPGDPVAYDRHKGLKCAEVLVPERVPPDLIIGAYVSCEASRRQLKELCPKLVVCQFPHLFFGEGDVT